PLDGVRQQAERGRDVLGPKVPRSPRVLGGAVAVHPEALEVRHGFTVPSRRSVRATAPTRIVTSPLRRMPGSRRSRESGPAREGNGEPTRMPGRRSSGVQRMETTMTLEPIMRIRTLAAVAVLGGGLALTACSSDSSGGDSAAVASGECQLGATVDTPSTPKGVPACAAKSGATTKTYPCYPTPGG